MLLGNGDGTFQPAVNTRSGSDPDAIVAGDFNGDGRLDLAVADQASNDVSILLGNGDGTFQTPVQVTERSRVLVPDAIVAGDFNGDGRLDLAVAERQSNDVSILLGNGDGTFQPQVTYAVGTGLRMPSWRVTSMATAGSTWPSPTADRRQSQMLLGNGDGTFQPAQTVTRWESFPMVRSWPVTSPATAGSTWPCGGIYATASEPWTSLGAAGQRRRHVPARSARTRSGRSSESIVAGDFNGDGRLDLAVARLHRIGTFDAAGQRRRHLPARRSLYAVGIGPVRLVAGDFNGDGHLDLAVAGETASTHGNIAMSRCSWATATARSSPQVTYAAGSVR